MQVPAHVEYERATSVEHALSLLSRPETRVVAGGHSLIPMMKLRLAQRAASVDGSFEIASPPGGPTLITVDLPCVR